MTIQIKGARVQATIASLLILTSATAAWGQIQPKVILGDLYNSTTVAQLVVHGQVIDIVYARAEPTEMEPLGMPHMFITYRVDEVLHGNYDERELTLRFLGGYDDEDNSYLGTNLTPRFDIGDEDILFVTDNGSAACPLVGNHRGRYRVIDGRVYDDSGHSLRLDSERQTSLGARYDLPEVTNTEVMGEILVGNYDPDARKGPSDAAPAADILELLREIARETPRPSVVVDSADPGKPFFVADYVPAPMSEDSGDVRRR